jgi:hypothetical protein
MDVERIIDDIELQISLYTHSGQRCVHSFCAMKTQSSHLQSILQELHQLSERLHGTCDPQNRVDLLRVCNKASFR